MYEIIMLFAFLCAATCQFLPRTNRGDNPGLLRKKRIEGIAPERSKASAPKQQMRHKRPVSCSNRKPALHVQHDMLRQGWEGADGIQLNRIDLSV